MNRIPIRLGPLSLVLTVITISMVMLSILTFSTAQADLRLAEAFAKTTQEQYIREQAGQEFLQEADAALAEGLPLTALNDITVRQGIIEKTISSETASLIIGLMPDEANGYRIVCWRTASAWEPTVTISDNLWDGT